MKIFPPFELVDSLCEIQKPDWCGISQITWETIPYVMRYTGCRVGEAAQLTAKDVFESDGILIMYMVAEKSEGRKSDPFPDGRKEVPVHPKLKPKLEKAMSARPDGFLFPDVGVTYSKHEGKKEAKFGARYRTVWLPLAREIWPLMKVHSWRSYVSKYLTKVAGVPETVSEDICGHARGTINRDYSGRAPLQQLYEAV